MSLLVVQEDQVRQLISPAECIAAVDQGFRLRAQRQIEDTQTRLAWSQASASLHMYGALVPQCGLGAKVLTAFEHNPEKGEPFIYALIVMLDPGTGRPHAILEGGYLTALRTAAATALGARHLSRPDSRVLGILGTGLQARTHLLCHLAAMPFEKVLIWGRHPERVEEFVDEMQAQVNVPLIRTVCAERVCRQSDVLTTTTRADCPLFSADAVRPGTHIGIAGPMRDSRSEVPLDLLPHGSLFVDSREKFLGLWSPGTAPFVEAELGDVMLGTAAGRTSQDQITLFKPVGMAFEDIVSARVVLDHLQSAPGSVAAG